MSILKKHFGNGTEKKDIRNAISLIAIIIIVVVLVLNSFYKVGEQEQAVITMFGQVQGIKSAGLYTRIPFIQKVYKVDTTTHGMPIGYTIDDASRGDEESAATATKVLMDFMVVFLKCFIWDRACCPDVINNRPTTG